MYVGSTVLICNFFSVAIDIVLHATIADNIFKTLCLHGPAKMYSASTVLICNFCVPIGVALYEAIAVMET